MGALLGATLAIGVLLVVSGLARRRGSRPPGPVRVAWSSAFERRRTLVTRSGRNSVTAGQTFAAQGASAVAALLLVVAATGSIVLGSWAALAATPVVPMWLHRAARARSSELRDCWPDVVDSLAASLRAGLSIPEAVADLEETGPPALRAHVRRGLMASRASGRFDDCLITVKGELADPVADRVVEVLRMARATGGADIGVVLRTFSDLLRQENRLRAELEARQAWTVNSAKVAVAAPWLVLLLLGTSSSGLEAYDSVAGSIVLSVGAVVCLVAYRLMLRLGRISTEPRVMA